MMQWWSLNIQQTKKFMLFHVINKNILERSAMSWQYWICQITSPCHDCHNAAIFAVATCEKPTRAPSISSKKWFKLAAWHRAEDAFWCPKDECVKNQSNLMLTAALDNNNALYREVEMTKPPLPKWRWPQAEEESLDDLALTVKTAMRSKNPKSALKSSLTTSTQQKTQTCFNSISPWWPHRSPQLCNSWECYLQCNKTTEW